MAAQSSFRFNRALYVKISGAYTLQKTINLTDKNAKNYKHDIPYTPRHSGNLGVSLETPWLNLGYTILMVGDRYSNSQNLSDYLINRYTEQTATLWRQFQLRDFKLRIQGDIVNLANAQYDIIRYYPMQGRSYKLTVRLEY